MRSLVCMAVLCLSIDSAFSSEPFEKTYQVIFVAPETWGIRRLDGAKGTENQSPRTRVNLSFNLVHRFVVTLGESKDVMICKLLVRSGDPRVERYLDDTAIPVGFTFDDLQRIDEGESVFKVFRFPTADDKNEPAIANPVTVTTAGRNKTVIDLIAESGNNAIMYIELKPN